MNKKILILIVFLTSCRSSIFLAAEDSGPKNTIEDRVGGPLWIQRGDMPFIITVPHGGPLTVNGVEIRKKGTIITDIRTLELVELLNDLFIKIFSRKPYIVASRISRKYIDFNRSRECALEDPQLNTLYDEYHASIERAGDEIRRNFSCGLLIDIHGQSAERSAIFLGTNDTVTIEQLTKRRGNEVWKGDQSLAALFEKYGYTTFPSSDDLTSKEDERYNGGYTVQRHGINNPHGIDAIQLEIGLKYRYTVEEREKFGQDLAQVLMHYYELYFLPKL